MSRKLGANSSRPQLAKSAAAIKVPLWQFGFKAYGFRGLRFVGFSSSRRGLGLVRIPLGSE